MIDPENPTEDVSPPDDDETLGLDPEIPAEVVAVILESETPQVDVTAAPEAEPIPEPVPVEAENDVLVLQAVDRLGERIDQRLAILQAQFDREVRAEASRERIVDRLHAELQEYKQDLLLKVQRPIFSDLIQLHDDVGKMAEAQEEDDAAVRGMLESIQTAVEDVLYRQGVEPFRNEGELFDPRRQRALATTSTDDPSLAKTVARRLRPGFQAGEKIIRPEIVTVYTHQT